MPQADLQQIVAEVQLFNTLEQKENVLFLLGTLTALLISLVGNGNQRRLHHSRR